MASPTPETPPTPETAPMMTLEFVMAPPPPPFEPVIASTSALAEPLIAPPEEPPPEVKREPEREPPPKPEAKPKPKPKPKAERAPDPIETPAKKKPEKTTSSDQASSTPSDAPASFDSAPQGVASATPGPTRASASGPPPSYLSRLLADLASHKNYPRRSRSRGEQGEARLFLVIGRDGSVLSSKLMRSTGYADLDAAVNEMVDKANPLPPLPDDYPEARMELIVPITFTLR